VSLSSLDLGLLLGAAVLFLPLADPRRLAATAAQIIELRAAHLPAADEFDGVNHRRIEREHAFHPLAIGDFAHSEILVQPGARAANAHPLIGLYAGALALDHLVVDENRVSRRKVGDALAGGKLGDLLL